MSGMEFGSPAVELARSIRRRAQGTLRSPFALYRLQYSLSHCAVGAGAASGQSFVGTDRPAPERRLAGTLSSSDLPAGEFRGHGTFSRHLLSGGQLDLPGVLGWPGDQVHDPCAGRLREGAMGLSLGSALAAPSSRATMNWSDAPDRLV